MAGVVFKIPFNFWFAVHGPHRPRRPFLYIEYIYPAVGDGWRTALHFCAN